MIRYQKPIITTPSQEVPRSDRIVRLRFCKDYAHVDSVTPDDKHLGMHNNNGCQAREKGYDKRLGSGDMIVELPVGVEKTQKFYEESYKHIGEGWGIVSPHGNDCAGFQLLMLLRSGCIEITPGELAEIVKRKFNLV